MTNTLLEPAPSKVGKLPPAVATTTLMLAPLLLVAGTLITPAYDAEPASYLPVFADQAGRVQLGAVLFAVGHLLLAPALLSAVRTVPGKLVRGASFATAYGAMVFGAFGLTRLFEVAVATHGGDPAAVEAFNEMPAAAAVVLPGVAGMLLGGLLLFVGLARAHVTPWWLLVPYVAGQAAVMTGGDGTAVGVIGSVLLAATFGLLGWTRARR